MTEEKLHIINLRKEFIKAPSYKKSKKAITAIKEYISRHMKVSLENVKIERNLNLKIWEHGRKNPPAKIKVKSMVKDNKAYVELPEFPFEETKKKETKTEEMIEKKKEDLKTLEKEKLKEMKKEHNPEPKEMPSARLKEIARIKEKKEKYSRVIAATGKKGAKETKP